MADSAPKNAGENPDDGTPVGQYPENVPDPKPQAPLMEGEPGNKTVDQQKQTST